MNAKELFSKARRYFRHLWSVWSLEIMVFSAIFVFFTGLLLINHSISKMATPEVITVEIPVNVPVPGPVQVVETVKEVPGPVVYIDQPVEVLVTEVHTVTKEVPIAIEIFEAKSLEDYLEGWENLTGSVDARGIAIEDSISGATYIIGASTLSSYEWAFVLTYEGVPHTIVGEIGAIVTIWVVGESGYTHVLPYDPWSQNIITGVSTGDTQISLLQDGTIKVYTSEADDVCANMLANPIPYRLPNGVIILWDDHCPIVTEQ